VKPNGPAAVIMGLFVVILAGALMRSVLREVLPESSGARFRM